MRISNALCFSGLLAIGVAITSIAAPAEASTFSLNSQISQATEAENNNDSVAPYRGSGR